MYIDDVIKESGEAEMSKNKMKSATKLVRMWLIKDGYLQPNEFEAGILAKQKSSQRTHETSSSAASSGNVNRKDGGDNTENNVDNSNRGDDNEDDDEFGCAALFDS